MKINTKRKLNQSKIHKFDKSYIWYFDTNEGYGREQFICVAKDENEVLELYNNPNKIYECDKDVILNGCEKLSDTKPLVFDGILFEHRRSDNQLKLIKKIETYNTIKKIIYDTTS